MVIKRNYLGLLLIILLGIGCSQERSQEKKCGLNSAITLSHINESGLRQLLLRSVEEQDSIFVAEVVNLLDAIVTLTNEIIENNGGIDPSTLMISNGCNTGIVLNEIYEKSELSTLKVEPTPCWCCSTNK